MNIFFLFIFILVKILFFILLKYLFKTLLLMFKFIIYKKYNQLILSQIYDIFRMELSTLYQMI